MDHILPWIITYVRLAHNYDNDTILNAAILILQNYVELLHF